MARPLTHRQIEVLELIAKGLTNPEIGDVLSISMGTVKSHVSAIIESLGVTNRTEAVGMLSSIEVDSAPPGVGTAVPGFGKRPAIAVLPFEEIDATGDFDWFAQGLLADLTRRAGNLRWFPVIQLDSTRTLREDEDAAGALGARYLIDGSVFRDAGRLSVTVRGRDAESGENIWAARIERPVEELESFQQEILERIAQELAPAVLRLEQVRGERQRADAIAVWDLCKRAAHHVDRETARDYAQAVAYFGEAHSLAPDSPAAWAGLSLAHSSALYVGLVEDLRETSKRAIEAARRAVELAPEAFDSQLSLGRAFALSRQDERAEKPLERALELDPSSSLASNTLAGTLRRQGRPTEAIPWYERCIRLSPRSPQLYHVYGGLSLARLEGGDYEEALRCARLAVAGDPSDGGGKALDFFPIVPASLALLGRVEEAREVWQGASARASTSRLRHSARFTGEGLDALVEGLRLAGWDGKLR